MINPQTPFSSTFNQHYWSVSGGVAEKQHVFIEGNDLPRRFAKAKAFTVAELGFGTGLTLALTRAVWEEKAQPSARLTYISYELEPLNPQDLATIQEQFPAPLQNPDFLAMYNPLPGWNIWSLPSIDVHVFVGDALEGLQTHPTPADAWFLDGFSPDTNPAMWSPALLMAVGQHTGKGGTASTYSVAQAVRNGLVEAGFQIEKAPGHPPKRHMLRARKL